MKIFISEADKETARRIALKNLARFFDIPDWETKGNETLLENLSHLSDTNAITIVKLLKDYFEAYDKWFMFYQNRKKKAEVEGDEYKLNDSEHYELKGLIKMREDKLKDLQEMFDELQLSRLSKGSFGTDIDGIIKD